MAPLHGLCAPYPFLRQSESYSLAAQRQQSVENHVFFHLGRHLASRPAIGRFDRNSDPAVNALAGQLPLLTLAGFACLIGRLFPRAGVIRLTVGIVALRAFYDLICACDAVIELP